MFFFTTSASGDWNSQTLPHPQNVTPLSAKRLRTSDRCSALRVGSTPCLCVVRHSTAAIPTDLQILRIVGRSHWAATLYVTIPSLKGGNFTSGGGESARVWPASAQADEATRNSRRVGAMAFSR